MQPLPQSIANVFAQGGDLHHVIEAISGIPDFPNPWGSGQYAAAAQLFETLRILAQYLPENELYPLLGLNVALGTPETPQNALTMLQLERIENEVRHIKDDLGEFANPFTELISRINDIRTFTTIDQILNHMANSSWDAWSAIPTVFDEVYPGAQITYANGTVPEQGSNIDIGLKAYLLWLNGYVHDSDAFSGFST